MAPKRDCPKLIATNCCTTHANTTNFSAQLASVHHELSNKSPQEVGNALRTSLSFAFNFPLTLCSRYLILFVHHLYVRGIASISRTITEAASHQLPRLSINDTRASKNIT